jgi:hypothetical protein
MVYSNCPPNSFENYKPFKKRKRQYEANEKTDLERRASNLARKLEVNARRYADDAANKMAAQARKKQYYDDLFIRRIGKLEHLNPKATDRVGQFLANNFNQKARHFGLSPNTGKYSTAGEVRYGILESRRLAEGFVEEVGRYKALQEIKKVVGEIKDIAKGKNLPFESVDELIQAAVEVGQIPAKRGAYGIGKNGEAYLMSLYDDFVALMKDSGFSSKEINDVISSAARISEELAEVRAIGNAFNLNIGDTKGIGYFERIMTDTAEKFIRETKSAQDVLESLKNNVSSGVDQGKLAFTAALEKSRKTFKFIPEDEALLAYMLGKEIDELRPILSDPKEFTKFLRNNLSDDQVEQLVDMGIASKVPMLTQEVFEYFTEQFSDLPFKGMAEMFVTNPVEMAEYYVQNLKKSVGQSAMLRTIFRDGLEQGWAITADEVASNPNLFKGFKKIDADAIKVYVPDFPGKGEIFVHPIVFNSWKAILDVSTSPAHMGTISGLFKYFGSFLTQSLLMTPQYILRNLYSATIATSAAGGNYLRSFDGIASVFKAMSGGLDTLDNTKKVFRIGDTMYTKRELFTEFVRHRAQDVNPGLLDPTMWNPQAMMRNIQNPGRQLNYWWQYTQAFGAGKGAAYFADLIKNTQNAFFQPLAAFGNALEAGMKFATLMSLTDTSPLNRVGQFVSSLGEIPRNFNSLDSVFRHIDDYFYAFDDVGRVTAGVSRYVRPFAIYAMNNPPAVIRHAMRNPGAFLNYWRLRSFMNGSAAGDEEINEATVPDYVSDQSPLFFFRDKDVAVALLTNNYDPIAEATSYLNKSARDIASMFGWYVGTSGQQREQMEGRQNLLKVVQDMFKETQPLYRNAVELVTGIDSSTGKPISDDDKIGRESFLGVRMNPVVKWLLSSYPPLENLDRFNPGGVFGEPGYIDPRTNRPYVDPQGRVYEGKPSWAGYTRTYKQIDKYHPVNQQLALRPLRWAGFQVKVLDLAANAQWTYDDIQRMENEAKNFISRANKAILTDQKLDDKERERLVNEIRIRADQWAQLRIDRERVKRYMAERGIPPSEMHRKVLTEMAKDMPQIDDRILVEITKEYLEMQGIKEK